MALTNADIIKYYQRDRDAKQAVLDERIPDLHFARWSQNDDLLGEVCTTEFVGQFDIISRERKRIQSEFRHNPIEVKFRNKKDDDDKLDELMQGKYRTDRRLSKSKQCFDVAQDDVIDVGFGAWRLCTENEDDLDTLSTNLEIRREPIIEAVRRVFFDCNSRLLDKSDASCVAVITSFTEEGYKKELERLGVDQDKISFISFDQPYESIYEKLYPFAPLRYPFFSKSENKLTLLEFYNLEPKRQTYYLYLDADGEPYTVKKEDAQKNEMPEPVRKKTITEHRCYKYVSNGLQILKRTKVPGGQLPVIPAYGERNFIENTENHYGIVKAAKDPQNLINSAYNYLASMMMFSPVPKPDFDPREVEGLEHFHEGSANSHKLAYTLRNKTYTDEDGNVLNFTQPTYTQPPNIPPAVAALMQQLPAMTDSILNPGVTEDAFNTQASGVAIQEITKQIGIQTYIYMDNFAEAMRRDGEVYAAMFKEVFDTERKIILTNVDGTTTDETINQDFVDFTRFNPEMGFETATLNDMRDVRFDVQFDIGPSYQSKKDAVLANLKDLFVQMPDGDPMKRVILLSILSKQTGEGMDEINKASRFDLLSLGLPGFEPQTDQETRFVQQLQLSQQNQQPNPQMILAQAEATKAEADLMREQRELAKDQVDAQTSIAKSETDRFNAETNRLKVQVDAQKAEADIDNKDADTLSKRIDNGQKMADMVNQELQRRLQSLPIEQLINLNS